MDATCKVQDNIHVFRLVHNMCPGFWVHITICTGFFFDIKRGVQILISVHLCWYLSYFGSKNILYLEYIQIYLCVKLSIWIKALSSKVRVGCSTHKQQLASRLQQVQILLLAYLCGLDPYELHRSLSLGR